MKISLASKKTRNIGLGPHLQQTAFWGWLKKEQKCGAMAFDIVAEPGGGRKTTDFPTAAQTPGTWGSRDLLVVLRPIGPDVQMAYVPYGPEPLQDEQRGGGGRWLEVLSERMRPHLPENCVFIRYDLPWQSPWVDEPSRYTPDRQWMGGPGSVCGRCA